MKRGWMQWMNEWSEMERERGSRKSFSLSRISYLCFCRGDFITLLTKRCWTYKLMWKRERGRKNSGLTYIRTLYTLHVAELTHSLSRFNLSPDGQWTILESKWQMFFTLTDHSFHEHYLSFLYSSSLLANKVSEETLDLLRDYSHSPAIKSTILFQYHTLTDHHRILLLLDSLTHLTVFIQYPLNFATSHSPLYSIDNENTGRGSSVTKNEEETKLE